MKSIGFPLTAALLVALFLHVPSGSGATVNIAIQGFAFSPQNPTINVGDTVIWTQNDATTHTVSSTAAPFVLNSGNLTNGKTYTNTFATAGTFAYRCNIHTSMTGSVIVQAVPTLPDLVVTNVTVLGGGNGAASVTLAWTVVNVGGGTAGPGWYDGVSAGKRGHRLQHQDPRALQRQSGPGSGAELSRDQHGADGECDRRLALPATASG